MRTIYGITLLLIFYGVVLLLVVGLTVSSYRALRRHGRIVAIGLTLLLLAGLVLIWPVPYHGGIGFVGENLYRKLVNAQRQYHHDAQQQQTAEFNRRIADRVAGPLPFTVIQPLSGSWSSVQTNGNTRAWHDADSGLLWSDWLPLQASSTLPSLRAARERCQQLPPTGYWALTTEAENYYLWKAAGEQYLPPAPASSVVQFLDAKTRLEMPVYHLKTASDNNYQSSGDQHKFVTRCTARGPGAPKGGYRREDIPLQQWNLFQMRRMATGND